MSGSYRMNVDFCDEVRRTFAFLKEAQFLEVEAQPTLVRFRRGDIEVAVYHGRNSYEIGCELVISGTRYGITEIVRVFDPELAERFRYTSASTSEEVAAGLHRVAALLQRYGELALSGNPEFISNLALYRKAWSESYALDVKVRHLRPQAELAFRNRNFSLAADLYGQIRERLSPAETKKLLFALSRKDDPT